MSRHIMLDSGAFSVWSKGAMIDLRSYINFCLDHPGVSYYVNLDVIPGVFRDKKTLRDPDAVGGACYQGWSNYMRMLDRGVPKDKVIPVYHQHDPIKWLVKYLEFGVKYVGISPANDCTTSQKLEWMKGLRRYLFDKAGKPLVRTHGFAVTSYRLMNYWHWHSVDSASWKLAAAWGAVYVPQTVGCLDDYTKPPLLVVTSPNTLNKVRRQKHVSASSPRVRARILAHLESIGLSLGETAIRKEKVGYKLDRETGEYWHDKRKGVVGLPVVLGVENDWELRALANAVFVRRANKVLPIDHIYFAGAPIPNLLVEKALRDRLLSFHEMKSVGSSNHRCLTRHVKWVESNAHKSQQD